MVASCVSATAFANHNAAAGLATVDLVPGSHRVRIFLAVSDIETSQVLIHAIRVDQTHWPDLWNFSLRGTRNSPSLSSLAEGWTQPSAIDLSVLNGPVEDWPDMALSGTMIGIWLGALVREGRAIGVGAPPYETRWAPAEVPGQILQHADRELALEAGRREHAPNAPSRLSCLWLADDLLDARNWIYRMMGPESLLLHVQPTRSLSSPMRRFVFEFSERRPPWCRPAC